MWGGGGCNVSLPGGPYSTCVSPPLPTAKLQVQFLRRHLDVEGIPDDPEHQAESQDQGPRVDEEVPVTQHSEYPQQQEDQSQGIQQERDDEKEHTAPDMASPPRAPQEHCPGGAGGAQLHSRGQFAWEVAVLPAAASSPCGV